MPIIKKIYLCLFAITTNIAIAGTMGQVENVHQSVYLKLGSGGSYSMNTGLNAGNFPSEWDPSYQGYNGKAGNTALYSAAIGYTSNPLWRFDFEYIYRPSYHYSKYQEFYYTPQVSPDFNPTARTRNFNLQSNSLMANLYFHGAGLSENLVWTTGNCYHLEPFIGGGLGVAFNTLSNFHSVYITNQVRTIIPDNFRTSFAWQLSAGLNLYNDSHFNLAAGYRYYNGGTFTANNYLIDYQQFTLFPWKGNLQANEFFITLAYKINAP